jgi:polyisoprenoid-binding protein YceI
MKKIFALLLLVSLQVGLFAQTTWKNNKAHSKLTFSVTHLSISDVTGLFTDFDVTITNTKPDFSDAVFQLTVNVSSINTDVEMRDNDLKSANFFDATTYPTITFKSTSIKKTGDGKYELTGNLTMHGVTKTVTMNLWYRGTITNPMSKKPDAGFKLTGTLKRTDFNIATKYPSTMISDDVDIIADGEFDQQ